MKVVFLDIDGVLNSTIYNRTLENRKVCVDPQDIGWWAMGIDPDAVARLNRLLRETGADVVVSSSWRYAGPAHWLQRILVDRGFEGEVVDTTPRLGDRWRRDEISAWVDEHEPEAFVVLDDDEEANVPGRFVRTSAHRGLTDEDVDRAVGIVKAE